MLDNFFHFLADSFHDILVEQPVLHLLDQIDQIDRWVLDSQQQSETTLLDIPLPMDGGGSDFFDFSS
jgi:hypothetical protein